MKGAKEVREADEEWLRRKKRVKSNGNRTRMRRRGEIMSLII